MATGTASRRTRSNPEEKRAEILDEALRIIAERGYNGFSIKQLASRCKLTNPGLLHHFGSKETLLTALLEERDRRDAEAVSLLLNHVKEAKKTIGYGLEEVRDAFRAIVARNSTQPEPVRLSVILGAESLVDEHPARAYFSAREAYILDIFSKLLKPFVPKPRSRARQLLAALYGLEIQWLRSGQAFDLLAEWEQTLELLLPEY